jgi:hypothetical protein
MRAMEIPVQRREDAITETIADWHPDELMEASDALVDMCETEGWRYFRKAVDAKVNALREADEARYVSMGVPAETEALKSVETRAEIRGLRSVEGIVDGVIMRATEDNTNG